MNEVNFRRIFDMKKYVIFLLLVILVGCSNDVSVYSTYVQKEKVVKEKEVVFPEVTIYGVKDSAKGYVIDTEKNKKWIVTVASSVVGHPKVLVETSTNQTLEGEVVAIDQENNIAMIFMKLTADIKPLQLDTETKLEISDGSISEAVIHEELGLQGIFTVNKIDDQFTTTFVNSRIIQQVLTEAKDKPIEFDERLAAIPYFSDFPKVNYQTDNLILNHDKETFTYNPDELYQFVNDFQIVLNSYFEEGDITPLEKYIASDDLRNAIQSIKESHQGVKQFGQLQFTSSMVNDFQYIVEAKTTLNLGEEVGELKGTYKCILMNGELKMISVYYR